MNKFSVVDIEALLQLSSSENIANIDGLKYIIKQNNPLIVPEVLKFAKTNPLSSVFDPNPIQSTNVEQEIIELTPIDVISFYETLKNHIEAKMSERTSATNKHFAISIIKSQKFF